MPQTSSQVIEADLRRMAGDFRRSQAQTTQHLAKLSTQVSRPSLFWYGLWIGAAVLWDIVSVIELFFTFTGAGAIIVFLIDVIALILFVTCGYFAHGKIKRMARAGEQAQAIHGQLMGSVARMRRFYAGALRAGRKIKPLRPLIRKAALGISRRLRALSRNPFLRNLFASLAEVVPVLDLFPWQTYGAYSAYRDHKHTYEDAQASLQDLLTARQEEQAQFTELQEAMAEQAEDLEENLAA